MSYLDSYQKRGIFFQRHKLFYTTLKASPLSGLALLIKNMIPRPLNFIHYLNIPFKVSATLDTPSTVSLAFTPSTIFMTTSSGRSMPITFSTTFTGSFSNCSFHIGIFWDLFYNFTDISFDIHCLILHNLYTRCVFLYRFSYL